MVCIRVDVLDEATGHALSGLFKALGDPTRLHILLLLASKPCSVGDLAEHLGLTSSAVSHQLRLLKTMHLVRPTRSGQQVFYALDDAHVLTLLQVGLDHIRHS